MKLHYYLNKKAVFFSVLLFSLCFSSCANNQSKILENNKMQPIISSKDQKKNTNNKITKEELITQDTILPEIAVLLPTSGEHSFLASQMFNLIKIGIEDAGYNKNLNLSIYDGATSTSILESSNEIISRDTKLIIGPLFAKLLNNLYVNTNENIPIISFTNDKSIFLKKSEAYNENKNIYLFGHAPFVQSKLIINFIFQEEISHDAVLLLPYQNNNLIALLKAEITKNNGNIVNIITYNTQDEIAQKVAEAKIIAEKYNNNPSNLKKIAIYIADNQKGLSEILKQIKQTKLDKITNIFGDNRLDSSIYKDIDMYYTGTLVEAEKLNQIINTTKEFNYMHKLAYDVGLLLGKILQVKESDDYTKEDQEDHNNTYNITKDQIINNIQNSGWIKGSTGYFKIKNHITTRKYDILKNTNGKVVKVKSAS